MSTAKFYSKSPSCKSFLRKTYFWLGSGFFSLFFLQKPKKHYFKRFFTSLIQFRSFFLYKNIKNRYVYDLSHIFDTIWHIFLYKNIKYENDYRDFVNQTNGNNFFINVERFLYQNLEIYLLMQQYMRQSTPKLKLSKEF